MAEGFYRSGEARPSDAGISEPTGTDSAYTADEEKPGPSRRHTGTRVAETAPEASAAPARSILKRPLLLLMAVVLLGVAAMAGWQYYAYFIAHEWTDDAFIEGRIIQISPKVAGHVLRVDVIDNQEVHQGDLLLEIDPRDYTSRLKQARAVLQAALTKQQEAQSSVELVNLTANASIQQAAASVALAKSAVQAAQAQVVMARSRLEQARAQVDTPLANAAQMRAQVAAVEAEVTRADADVKRAQELYRGDQIVSRRDLDHATKDARVAAAQLEAARKKVSAAEAQVAEARAAQQTAAESLHYMESQVLEARARVDEALGRLAAANAAPYQVAMSRSQADTASAEVAQARAAVERAELDLASTRLSAPEAGRVTRKAVEAGAYVQIGQSVMAIVPHDVWVVANFMETQLASIRPGQPVEIKVDAYPSKVFMGHVDSMQAGTGSRFSLLPPENATGNFVKVVQRIPVKIVFDTAPDPDYPLSPGMSVVPVVRVQ
jgi:membrane fusion protein (multidrug efflux system)